MKKIASLIILIQAFLVCSAIEPLGKDAEVSLITCSEGDELYSVFGHSAIRIVEPNRFDVVYNYGTFEFSDDFYILFAQGKLNYTLSRSGFKNFNYEYIVSGRGVVEQVLDLTQVQKQAVFDFLEVNYQPENREYLYDFFYDNCATRIRDLFKEVLGEDLVFNSQFETGETTFRSMIDEKLQPMDWSDFGIDIALGIPCDAIVEEEQNMFLPDELYTEFGSATLNGKPLVKSEEELLVQTLQITNPPIDWTMMLCAFFVLIAAWNLLQFVKKGSSTNWIPAVIFFIVSLVGLGVFLLWFATDHVATKWNMNLFWAFPLHFVVYLIARKRPKATRNYFKLTFISLLFFILIGWTFPQSFHLGFYLIALSVALVSFKFAGFGKKELNL
ncbi:MAG: DUF4105 domain-containing protein [Flavobacteriales bacterium]|nr:DUF4105 domain-containing protein [Flavobacteriales bacterium]MDG1780294.1 DUF4105 domain-containing protein [Flavobacteriales bacterium]MDG2245355.1 DUF4105 domain-containing protein [Flavobacteriales bacterium]